MSGQHTRWRRGGHRQHRHGQASVAAVVCLTLFLFFAAVVWDSQRLAFDYQAWQASVLVQLLCIVAIVQTLILALMTLRRT